MNKLDCLRDELMERGFPKSQINMKVLPAILDVIANSDYTYTKTWEEESEHTKRLNGLIHEEEILNKKIAELKKTHDEYKIKYSKIQKLIDDKQYAMQSYITQFYEALKACDTDEGRDTMRKIQVFLDLVDVQTKENNTAYINALGNILSQGKMDKAFNFMKVTRTEPYIEQA